MFWNRFCHGDIVGTLQLKIPHRYESGLHLKRRIFQFSAEKGIAHQPRYGELKSRPFCTLYLYQGKFLASPPASCTLAFITSLPGTPYHQQQSFASTQAKPPRSANRWRSPILRPPVVAPGSKRPPKLYKRLRNVHGSMKSNDDHDVSTIVDDGKTYRADRVLANRTGKSRKECFQLLQERRVFMVTDELYNEVSPKQLKRMATDNSALVLQQNSSSTEKVSQNSDIEDGTADKQDSTNIVQQYRLEVITGPAIKIGMNTKLRIDKYQDVPLPPPLLMIYHKPKVRIEQ